MTVSTPLTILIVDDSPEDRAVCSRLLRRHSAVVYTCIEAVAGAEGLALYHSARPDCLFLDFNLPDMDGLQFLAAMQAEVQPQRCPVVLLTGQGSEQIAVLKLQIAPAVLGAKVFDMTLAHIDTTAAVTAQPSLLL